MWPISSQRLKISMKGSLSLHCSLMNPFITSRPLHGVSSRSLLMKSHLWGGQRDQAVRATHQLAWERLPSHILRNALVSAAWGGREHKALYHLVSLLSFLKRFLNACMQLQIIHFELLTAVMILLFISFNLAKLKAELGRTLVGTTTRHEGQN